MEDNKKFELNDETLDSVAGGRDGFAGVITNLVEAKNYACSNCGGGYFAVTDNDTHYYNGNCRDCGTYNSRIGTVNGDDVRFIHS